MSLTVPPIIGLGAGHKNDNSLTKISLEEAGEFTQQWRWPLLPCASYSILNHQEVRDMI